MQTVLIASRDTELRQGLRLMLESDTTAVRETGSAKEALSQMDDGVDLVILGTALPDGSGLAVCRELRKRYTAPILFIADTEQEERAAEWLYAGGDDCFVKTYSCFGIAARIKALLRRYCIYKGKQQSGAACDGHILSACGLSLALDRNQARVKNREISLTEIEYQILRLLMQYPERIFSTEAIYEKIWGEPYYPISNGTVMVHIRNLRLKVEEDPQSPALIKTVWGKGYRFEPARERAEA